MSRGTILVIGVGGIGGPAAMALARPGGPSLRLVDPDVVESSNLPRQVLFLPDEVGQRKALLAARRLSGKGVSVEGVVDRFDESTASRLLRDVGVAIDATDGAATKDLVNSIVVEAGIPLVHAAAIQSEARLLEIPAGGRPCIACVFGYASESPDAAGDTCARVGVWPSVPGAIGALAAHAALARIAMPAARSNGLQVLDFATPRALSLGVRPDSACPACGAPRRRPNPVPHACAWAPEAFDEAVSERVVDLRLEQCPMNLFRAKMAIDATDSGVELELWLGAEGAETVPSGLAALGHRVLVAEPRATGLRLVVRRGGGASASSKFDEDWHRRYARQIVLPEVGEAGQRRIAGADVVIEGESEASATAALHLKAAGVGSIRVSAVRSDRARGAGRWTLSAGHLAGAIDRRTRQGGALARFDGAVAADALLRAIVLGTRAPAFIAVSDDGVVRSEPIST